MLHIVLLILKIIGIILLCILGILLLGIVCVLLVPVRYRIELDRAEGEDEPPIVVKARITWLLHLLNVLIRYPAEVTVRVRILFFNLFRIPKKMKHSNSKLQEANRKDVQSKDKTLDEETLKQEAKIPEQEPLQSEEILQTENNHIPIQKEIQTAKEESSHTKEHHNLKEKWHKLLESIQNILRKIKELFQNIQYTIEHFCDRIKSVSDQIEYYRGIISSDAFQQSFQLCKGELLSILKSLRPQKFNADIVVGMDDPATTGEILAIWGMLYPIIGEHVSITGDFEQNRIEGHVLVKGRIRAITFVKAVIRIYFNKDIRQLIHLLKKEAA